MPSQFLLFLCFVSIGYHQFHQSVQGKFVQLFGDNLVSVGLHLNNLIFVAALSQILFWLTLLIATTHYNPASFPHSLASEGQSAEWFLQMLVHRVAQSALRATHWIVREGDPPSPCSKARQRSNLP